MTLDACNANNKSIHSFNQNADHGITSARQIWRKDFPPNFGHISLTSPQMKTRYSTLDCKPAWPSRPGPGPPGAVGPFEHPKIPLAPSNGEATPPRRSVLSHPRHCPKLLTASFAVDHRGLQNVAQTRHRISRPLSLLRRSHQIASSLQHLGSRPLARMVGETPTYYSLSQRTRSEDG